MFIFHTWPYFCYINIKLFSRNCWSKSRFGIYLTEPWSSRHIQYQVWEKLNRRNSVVDPVPWFWAGTGPRTGVFIQICIKSIQIQTLALALASTVAEFKRTISSIFEVVQNVMLELSWQFFINLEEKYINKRLK